MLSLAELEAEVELMFCLYDDKPPWRANELAQVSGSATLSPTSLSCWWWPLCEAVSCLQAVPDLVDSSLCTVVDQMIIFLNKDSSQTCLCPLLIRKTTADRGHMTPVDVQSVQMLNFVSFESELWGVTESLNLPPIGSQPISKERKQQVGGIRVTV